jgi:antirestriction protein ArdC
LRYYNVFNVAQTTGVEPIEFSSTDQSEYIPNQVAEDLCSKYFQNENVGLTHQDGKGCYYTPMRDSINMIPVEQFVDTDSYYKTLFHEMSHSTGHDSRLNRSTLTGHNPFGSEEYSKEELVAEITSMYLTGLTGITPKDSDGNSQAYINGWIKFAKDDKHNVVVHAMTQASKSADYILEA